jgi:hypothetical protein
LISGGAGRFRRFVNFFLKGGSGLGAGGDVEVGEDGDDAFEDAGAEGEEVEFTLAADVDEAGGFEFLDVVRERGGRDGQGGAGLGAAQWTASLGDALEQLKAARIGQGFEDRGAARGGETERFGGCSWLFLHGGGHGGTPDVGCNGNAFGFVQSYRNEAMHKNLRDERNRQKIGRIGIASGQQCFLVLEWRCRRAG